jgi:hypothetical protein
MGNRAERAPAETIPAKVEVRRAVKGTALAGSVRAGAEAPCL